MRKYILMLLLAVVSNSAIAEWIWISRTGKDNTYIDPATIRKDGNRVKMWSMWSLLNAQIAKGNPYKSIKEQSEYDCKEDQSRVLYLTFHSENMGVGNVVYTISKPNKWEPVVPGSAVEVQWKIACGK
jgi:hypothetical protein